MTSEQRLDRLERIAKLFVRAGLRERRNRSELEEKINIIVDYQIANEERFDKLAEAVTNLAEAQTNTEHRLDALIQLVERDRNGHSH